MSKALKAAIESNDPAADVERFEPNGTSQKDEGWDKDTLEEIVFELGDAAPEWMKKRVAEMGDSPEEEVDSSNRMSRLAEEEKFVIAWGGLDAEAGRKVEISFTNLPAEAFDEVAKQLATLCLNRIWRFRKDIRELYDESQDGALERIFARVESCLSRRGGYTVP